MTGYRITPGLAQKTLQQVSRHAEQLHAAAQQITARSDGSGLSGDPDVVSATYNENITRLETGFQTARDASSGTIEETGPFDQHKNVYLRGSAAFDDTVGFFTGTEAALFVTGGVQHPDYDLKTINITDHNETATAGVDCRVGCGPSSRLQSW